MSMISYGKPKDRSCSRCSDAVDGHSKIITFMTHRFCNEGKQVDQIKIHLLLREDVISDPDGRAEKSFCMFHLRQLLE